MYKNEYGYAEMFNVSPEIMKQEQDKAAAIQQRLDHLKGIGLPFANCAATHCSMATGGSWEERHPPICANELKTHQEDLDSFKAKERIRILQEVRQGMIVLVAG